MRLLVLAILILLAGAARADVLAITANSTVQNGTPDETIATIVDTDIRSGGDADTNYSTEDTIFSAYDGVSALYRIAWIKPSWTTGDIPAGATINSATLYLSRGGGGSTGTRTFSVYRVLQSAVADEMTGNVYSTGNSWQTAMGRGASDRDGTAIGSGNVVDSTDYTSADLTDWTQDVVDGSVANNGFFIEVPAGSFFAWALASSEDVDTFRPEFIVDWTAASGPAIPVFMYHQNTRSQ